MAEYEQVQRSTLKLKGVSELGVLKKKNKSKVLKQITIIKKKEEEKQSGLDKQTPTEIAFEKMQEKRQMERIFKKASKTHKERVEDFNRHLDTLTEYFDIPKISWTK